MVTPGISLFSKSSFPVYQLDLKCLAFKQLSQEGHTSVVKILLDKGASLTDKVREVKDKTIEDGGITVHF